MPAKDSENNILPKLESLSYYSLLILVFIVPLIFLKFIESSFDLAKKSALLVFGGFFIIITVLYFFTRAYGKDKKPDIFIDNKLDPAVLIFLAAAFASTVLSIKPHISFHGQYIRQIGFITFLYLFFIYFFSSQLFKWSGKTINVIRIMELVAAAVSLYAFIQYLHIDPFDTPLNAGTRPVSTMGHNTFAAGLIVLMFPFGFLQAFSSKNRYKGIILSLILAVGVIITQSRGAYAAAIISVITAAGLYPLLYRTTDAVKFRKLVRNNLLLIGIGAGVLIMLILLFPSNPFIYKLSRILNISENARWILWRDSLEAFKIHPFTGSGIATFPSVFEYFASYELKFLEPKSYFDHAHNVFIHILVSMGAIGLLAYCFMLFRGFYVSFKGFFTSDADINDRLIFLSAFASLAGYSVYSMADFEDTSMLLYFFIILAVLKALYSKYHKSQIQSEKTGNTFSYGLTVISAGIILFAVYNFYYVYNQLLADSHYRAGKLYYNEGNIKASIEELNRAVTVNYECAEYKYTLANYVQAFCLKNPGLKTETKLDLLRQAEQELERAKPNFFSHLQYQALLSIIKLQTGDSAGAEKLKQKIFKEDSLIVNYRNNLASYYFSRGDSVSLLNEIKAVFAVDPYNSEAVIIAASYYYSVNNKPKALEMCDLYLRKFPLDPYVLSVRERILSLP